MNHRDQAYILRSLVRNVYRLDGNRLPTLLVAAGGAPGVGTTTIAFNLAVAMARHGRRVAMIDGNLERPNVASLCGYRPRYRLADILLARRSVHEVIIPGPSGTQIVAGGGTAECSVSWTPATQQRLIEQLGSLERHVDMVIFDIGTSASQLTAPFWSAVRMLQIVMTTSSDSIMDAYATLKHLRETGVNVPLIGALVNRTRPPTAVQDVQRRIHQSCSQFLKMTICQHDAVPADVAIANATREQKPLSDLAPASPAAAAIDRLASRVEASLASLAGQPSRQRAA